MKILIRTPEWLDIKIVEEKYNAKYVGMFDHPKIYQGDITRSWPVFYTKEPHPKGSNYFMIYQDMLTPKVFIADGFPAIEKPRWAVIVNENEAIYSEHRHHYNSKDGIWIDGGSDYLRTGINSPVIQFKVIDGEFKAYEEERNLP